MYHREREVTSRRFEVEIVIDATDRVALTGLTSADAGTPSNGIDLRIDATLIE